jgi:hypothetical protein
MKQEFQSDIQNYWPNNVNWTGTNSFSLIYCYSGLPNKINISNSGRTNKKDSQAPSGQKLCAPSSLLIGSNCGINGAASKAIALKEQAICKIEILFTYKLQVLQRHKDIFLQDIEYHTTGKTDYMHQWINTNQAVIQKSMQDAKLKSILISNYFQPRGDPL